MPSNKLLLVDGMAVFYRGFFAIKNLSTSDGIPTNGLFGFVRMLNQLSSVCNPSHCLVTFDGGLPDERLSLLPEYKAQRPSMPDEMRQQLPLLNEYLEKASVPSLRIDGYEADDLIATITSSCSKEDTRIFIASSDKDLFQLVSENVSMISPSGRNDLMGREEVHEKTGVWPDQIVSWLALIGDTADNIPGIRGIGPKTAAKLLMQFDSVEGILSHIDDIENDRLRGLIKEGQDILERNIQIVQLKCDIENLPSLENIPVQKPKTELLSFFERVEFHKMARTLREPELF